MARYMVLGPGVFAGSFTGTAAEPTASRPVVEHRDRVYWALDGRDVVVLGKRWHVEVFSVVEHAGHRYVQLALDGPQRYMLTLRVVPDTPVNRLIQALLGWLTHPTTSGDVINVR
jgi:hypothetical protein